MCERGVPIELLTLNSYLRVYTEAVQVDLLDQVMSRFEEYGLAPDSYTYKHIIRMYVRAKEIDKALEYKREASSKGIQLAGVTYGLLLESLTHRDRLVEALKLLEEATDKRIFMPERHLRILRSRCKTLRVTHPDMPVDPNQWAKDLKARRRKYKNSTHSMGESLRTAISFAK
jgi:pentatricopeptide repeat protein